MSRVSLVSISTIAVVAITLLWGAFAAMEEDTRPPANADIVTAFARDVSGGAPKVMDSVAKWAVTPPQDMETIGFYSGEDGAPEERLWLATVSLLDLEGYLTSCEDKYCNEVVSIWQDKGLIDVSALPAPARDVFGTILSPPPEWGDGSMTADGILRSQRRFWDHFGEATGQVENQIASRGKALLSVDATDGDTQFFIALPPEQAQRWSGKGMARSADGTERGIRPVQWGDYWTMLTYAFSTFVAPADAYLQPPPPGTRKDKQALDMSFAVP